MKKIIISLMTILIMSSSYSQDSKVYFGASMGYTYPGGDFSSSQDLKQGIHFGLMDAGYRFSEKYGAAINFSASLQISEKYEEDVFFTLSYWGIGPTYTLDIGEKFSWYIKPQLALGLKAAINRDTETTDDDIRWKGSGVILGNAFMLGDISRRWRYSFNVDLFTGKFKESEINDLTVDLNQDNKFSRLILSVGARYNF